MRNPGQPATQNGEDVRADVVVRNRPPGHGKDLAVEVVRCPVKKSFIVMDSIPLAIPLLIGTYLDTLADCPDRVSLTLGRLSPGEPPRALPSDEDLIRAFAKKIDLCLAQGSEILVTSGDISRPYAILGEVDVVQRDFDTIRTKPTAELLEHLIREKAVQRYGNEVDAIINFADRSTAKRLGYDWLVGFHEERGNAYGRGVAIHFVSAPSSNRELTPSVADRLRELESLRRDELITEEEYERKRVEILESL